MHLRQVEFTYSSSRPFTKHRKKIQKISGKRDFKYIYKNKLDKVCFVHVAAYSDSKDLSKRTISEKVLKTKTYQIAINPKYKGCQRRLTSMVYKLLDNKTEADVNEELTQELRKTLIKKFKRKKAYVWFKDNI